MDCGYTPEPFALNAKERVLKSNAPTVRVWYWKNRFQGLVIFSGIEDEVERQSR
jgi:hypothetical protein